MTNQAQSQAPQIKSFDLSSFVVYVKRLSKFSAQFQIITEFFEHFQRWTEVRPSQSKMAQRAGVTRFWVNKVVKKLKAFGVIIDVKQRGDKMPSVYTFHADLQKDHVRGTLGSYFKSFCYMSLKALKDHGLGWGRKPVLQLVIEESSQVINYIETFKDQEPLKSDCLSCEVGESHPSYSCPALSVSFKTPETERGRSPSEAKQSFHRSLLSSFYTYAAKIFKNRTRTQKGDKLTETGPNQTLSHTKVNEMNHQKKKYTLSQPTNDYLESLSLRELRKVLAGELAKNDDIKYSTNPYRIVGADYRLVKRLEKLIAAHPDIDNNYDDGRKIATADDFRHWQD